MRTPKRARPRRPAVSPRPSLPRNKLRLLDELQQDPAFLQLKEDLGGPLTPSERATLDAHRRGTAGGRP